MGKVAVRAEFAQAQFHAKARRRKEIKSIEEKAIV
jgi:hypothetical protein